MSKKVCYKCKIELDLSEFHKCSSNKDGYQFICKTCKRKLNQNRNEYYKEYYQNNKISISEKSKERYLNNKEKILKKQKKYYLNNKGKHNQYSILWALKNKEKVRTIHREWSKKNYEKIRLNTIYQRMNRKKRIPLWANLEKINQIYLRCKLVKEYTGINYKVDHIIPLCGKIVCGLHVENNLQIITEHENRVKGNKFLYC